MLGNHLYRLLKKRKVKKTFAMSMPIKISLNIMFLVLGVLLSAQTLGILGDGSKEKIKTRISLSESLAVQCSILANRLDKAKPKHRRKNSPVNFDEIRSALTSFVQRNNEVRSAGLRSGHQLLISINDHQTHWDTSEDASLSDNIGVPIIRNKENWAMVEICYTPLIMGLPIFGFVISPLTMAIISITASSGVGSIFYFSKMFGTGKDGAVPSRVRSALDTLSEGLLVLDQQEKIVFSNSAFEDATGLKEETILGRDVAELGWKENLNEILSRKIENKEEKRRVVLQTAIGDLNFSIGVSEVIDDKGNQQGKIICFNDVTILEKRREELLYTMQSLQSSRDMIKGQNEKLKILATRDPLTNCWNRRSFFEEFTHLWKKSQKTTKPLSAIMLDIDHFKAVNDNHGHAMGDEVLRSVAGAVLELARESDVTCRYGGEEFCILLPDTDLKVAQAIAERYRRKIESLKFKDLKVTASQGVSNTILKAAEPEELLEQADQALYTAKRTGRNRVVNFNDVPADFNLKDGDESPLTRKTERENEESGGSIPFQVVASMMSVLKHRDPATAAHCVRVADLSFAMGRGEMSASKLYALEVGALLHDIGKIAVPDAILLKPERLTSDELHILRDHSRIGCELVEAAFRSQAIIDTVRYNGCSFAGNDRYPAMLKGEEIPLNARIVTIADAYDSMITGSIYRGSFSREKAIEELRANSGTQFDPKLVEKFVKFIYARPESIAAEKKRYQFTKDFALQLAFISEQITKSFDEQDFDLLRANAHKLESAANQYKNSKLKVIAGKLLCHSRITNDSDIEVEKIMSDVVELLELCQSAQRDLLQVV